MKIIISPKFWSWEQCDNFSVVLNFNYFSPILWFSLPHDCWAWILDHQIRVMKLRETGYGTKGNWNFVILANRVCSIFSFSLFCISKSVHNPDSSLTELLWYVANTLSLIQPGVEEESGKIWWYNKVLIDHRIWGNSNLTNIAPIW